MDQLKAKLPPCDFDFGLIFDRAEEYIFVLTLEGRIQKANPAVCRLLDCEGDDLLGRSFQELLGPEDASLMPVRFAHLIEVGSHHIEVELQDRRGRCTPVACSAWVVKGREGQGQAIVVFQRDRSAERRAKQALEDRLEMEKRITAISTRFVETPLKRIDEVIQTALEEIGRFRQVDRSYVFRFTPDMTRMSNDYEWCAEGIEAQRENLQNIETADYPWWTETLRRREPIYLERLDDLPPESGATRDVLEAQDIRSLVVVPMVFGDQVRGYLGFDSVRKEMSWAEADIRLLSQLAELIATALSRRDDQVERDRLRQGAEQTRRLEAIGRLAGGVAHDFNNLLTAITGYAEILKVGHGLSGEVLADVDEILRAASRAADLTGQLLAFSRKQVIVPQIVDPGEQVAGAVRMIDRLIGEHIDFRFVAADSSWPILIDPGQLEQIVVNLAVNARDAMMGGGNLSLRIGTVTRGRSYTGPLADLPEGDWVVLSVEDTGEGMDDETRLHAFEPFFSTKKQKGTGLGLATVYGIVKQNGGEIRISSRLGAGTRIDVCFPRAFEGIEPKVEKRLRPVPAAGGRILVVEDDERVRCLSLRVLERAGYEAVGASGGEEAIERQQAMEGPFELLVTDVVLNGANGREVYEAMKVWQPDLRVLFMSGYTDEMIAHQGVITDGGGFLAKPFTPRSLLDAVRQALAA